MRPRGGGNNPGNDTELVLHHSIDGASQFRFLAVDGGGHFGYIEHVPSKKIVHSQGSSLDPGDTTRLVLHSDKHAGALFGFDEESIVANHAQIWKDVASKGGSPNPGDDTVVELHSHEYDVSKFYFGDQNGHKMHPYPTPNVSGGWELLRGIVTPLADHKYSMTYSYGGEECDEISYNT